jgi:hypothetical protein
MMSSLDKQWADLCNAEQKEWERKTLEMYSQQVDAMICAPYKPKKEHSIVKGAVVGGIVAGPAGAIVGALVQKDKNDRGK